MTPTHKITFRRADGIYVTVPFDSTIPPKSYRGCHMTWCYELLEEINTTALVSPIDKPVDLSYPNPAIRVTIVTVTGAKFTHLPALRTSPELYAAEVAKNGAYIELADGDLFIPAHQIRNLAFNKKC
jgi:hypothetical protein